MDDIEREAGRARRRELLAEKRQKDLWMLDIHRQVVDLLFRGDDLSRQIRAEALQQIEKWERNNLCNPRYPWKWREWLDQPEKYARAAILREDDIGVSMRQNSPFGHALARLACQDGQAPGSQK